MAIVGNMVFMLNIFSHIIGNIRNKESWKIEQWWMSILRDVLCMILIFWNFGKGLMDFGNDPHDLTIENGSHVLTSFESMDFYMAIMPTFLLKYINEMFSLPIECVWIAIPLNCDHHLNLIPWHLNIYKNEMQYLWLCCHSFF